MKGNYMVASPGTLLFVYGINLCFLWYTTYNTRKLPRFLHSNQSTLFCNGHKQLFCIHFHTLTFYNYIICILVFFFNLIPSLLNSCILFHTFANLQQQKVKLKTTFYTCTSFSLNRPTESIQSLSRDVRLLCVPLFEVF